jgi:hypothetical protein
MQEPAIVLRELPPAVLRKLNRAWRKEITAQQLLLLDLSGWALGVNSLKREQLQLLGWSTEQQRRLRDLPISARGPMADVALRHYALNHLLYFQLANGNLVRSCCYNAIFSRVFDEDSPFAKMRLGDIARNLGITKSAFSWQCKKFTKITGIKVPGQKLCSLIAYSIRAKRVHRDGAYLPKSTVPKFELCDELEPVLQATEQGEISRAAFIRAVKTMCRSDGAEKLTALKTLGIDQKNFSDADQVGKFVIISDAVKMRTRCSKERIEDATREGAEEPRKWFNRETATALASIFGSRLFGREIIPILEFYQKGGPKKPKAAQAID